MNYFKIFFAFASVSFLFVSCKSKNNELTIPEDASTVVVLHGASITSKANWNDLIQADWFRREKQMTTDSFDKQLMEHPEQSGVDLKSDFIYFTHKRDFITYSVFEGKLKSASDFEKLLKEKNPGKKIGDGGSFNFMVVDSSDLVSWTSSKFVYIGGGQQLMGPNNSVPTDSLKAYAKSIFDLKKENSIESSENYAALMKEDGDIHFWSNSADVLSDFQFGPVPLIAASAMMQGSVTDGTINFENGKVVIKSRQYLNATLSKLIEKYNAKPLTADLLNHVSPSASIVIAMNYHPQLIKDFLKVSGTESSANKFLEDYNLTFDGLLQSTKGEILMTAAELGPQQNTSDDEMADDVFPFGGNLLFAASLNNDSAFKKVQTIIKQVFPTAATTIQNNWFLLGNSSAPINQFFSSNTNDVVSGKLSGHPIGIYIDIQKGLQQWNVHGLDSSFLQQIEISKNFWRDIVSTGGDFKNGAVNFETSINLADKSTNSLKQLAKYSLQMAAFEKKDEYVKNGLSQKNPFLAYNF
jgi:hypothetical protein